MNRTVDESTEPSNADIQRMIERALVRFQNWRVEVERNPNPMMVHQLKNLVSIIDSLSEVSRKKTKYSYKELAQGMAALMNEVAHLNMLIVEGLNSDDALDEAEEKAVTNGLLRLVQTAVELIGMVQERFGSGRKLPSAQNARKLIANGKQRIQGEANAD